MVFLKYQWPWCPAYWPRCPLIIFKSQGQLALPSNCPNSRPELSLFHASVNTAISLLTSYVQLYCDGIFNVLLVRNNNVLCSLLWRYNWNTWHRCDGCNIRIYSRAFPHPCRGHHTHVAWIRNMSGTGCGIHDMVCPTSILATRQPVIVTGWRKLWRANNSVKKKNYSISRILFQVGNSATFPWPFILIND